MIMMERRKVADYIKEQLDALNLDLADEDIESAIKNMKSDSTLIIEYLEKEKAERERAKWKGLINWALGVLTALLIQFLVKLLGLL